MKHDLNVFIVFNFENMNKKLKTRRKTFSKDEKSVKNKTRTNVCEYMFYFENIKEKRVQKMRTASTVKLEKTSYNAVLISKI